MLLVAAAGGSLSVTQKPERTVGNATVLYTRYTHLPTMEASKECGRREAGRVLTVESLVVTQVMENDEKCDAITNSLTYIMQMMEEDERQ